MQRTQPIDTSGRGGDDTNPAREELLSIAGFRLRTVYLKGGKTPIVLLHGYSFTSLVWRDINLLKTLEDKEIPYLAIDMPYGLKSLCEPKTKNLNKNLVVVKEAVTTLLDGREPIIVGASLGGYVALQYAVKNPVKGLVLIGPVGPPDPAYSSIDSPTLIIYGENDKIVALEELRRLSSMISKSRIVVYRGAGHAAYLDKPDDFRRDLITFYEHGFD